jgi:hypothetical protein
LVAFPLVAAVEGPTLDIAAWRRIVRAWLNRASGSRDPRGIVGLHDRVGTIFSLFFFAVRRRGLPGTTLCVPKVWLVEVAAAERATRATLESIEAVARRYGCETIAIEMPITPGPARDIVRALHCIDGVHGNRGDASPEPQRTGA